MYSAVFIVNFEHIYISLLCFYCNIEHVYICQLGHYSTICECCLLINLENRQDKDYLAKEN